MTRDAGQNVSRVKSIFGEDPRSLASSVPEDERQDFIDQINKTYALNIKSLRYDPKAELLPEHPGYTASNGDVVINPVAFTKQTYAGLLGSVWHEAFHVWQYDAYRGRVPKELFRTNTQTSNMMEAEAYRYMGTAQNPAYDSYTPYELNKVQEQYDVYRSQLNKINQTRADHYDFSCARLACGE